MTYDPKTGAFHLDESSDLQADFSIQFVYELRDDSLRSKAPDSIRKDWETISNWLECPSGELTEEHHEKISNAWKAYLAIGRSPSFTLQKGFDYYHNQYKSAGFDVKVNKAPPEVMDVFDRMLASDDEIALKKKFDFEVKKKKLDTILEKYKFKKWIKGWFHLFSSKPPQTAMPRN